MPYIFVASISGERLQVQGWQISALAAPMYLCSPCNLMLPDQDIIEFQLL